MKSKIVEVKAKHHLPFPKLVKYSNIEGTCIVLMHELERGTVVYSTNSKYSVGHFSNDWNMCVFEDFHGTLTINND